MSNQPPNILAIIPAREGSKRVPHKNFRPFAGTTLTDLAIQQGLNSKAITHLVVSSDSEEVLNIAAKYPKVIALKRPTDIADDHSPAIDYVRHTLQTLENEHLHFNAVVILQPSSPLRTAADIDATIQLLLDNTQADSAVSVVKVSHMVHPLKLKTLKGQQLMPFIEDEKGRFAANDLPDIYVRNCAVYVTWRRDLETRPDVIGSTSLAYVMPPETSVDINDPIDFDFAAFLYQQT